MRRAAFREWLTCAVAVAGAAAMAAATGAFGRIDRTLYDAGMALLERPAPADIVIVSIDQASLDRIGRWPWRRAVHATLLDRLTAARPLAVGLDMLLTEPDRGDPAGDQALADAIRRNGRIVLPVFMELAHSGALRPLAPAAPFASAAAATGHVHVELDTDGVARSVFLREGMGAEGFPHMALALAELSGAARGKSLPGERRSGRHGPPQQDEQGRWLRDYWVHLGYLGPPGHFKRLSYVEVLLGKTDPAEIEGKYVIVGATAAGMLDVYPTPVSGNAESMPGPEIVATALDGLLRERFIRIVPPWASALAAALAVLALLVSYLRLPPRRALLASAAACGGALLFSWALLALYGWWLAPAATVAGLVSCYPVWSWRRLEAAQRQMEEELERFAREPEFLESPEGTQLSGRIGDLVEQRIDQVRRATARLRDARRFVGDTLNGMPEGALVADRSLRVVLANPQASKLLAVDPAALAGRALPEALAPIAPPSLQPWDTLLERAPVGFEAKHPAGHELLVKVVPFVDAEGARRGLLVSLVDISELREAERARERTLGFISHDLRSPLASIVALLDLEELAPDAAPKDMHVRIRRHVERSLSLSDDFVQLGRAEAVNAARFEPVDLRKVLDEAIDEIQPLAAKRNMSITLVEAPASAQAAGVRDVLVRVFINLLSNAVKYGREATPIECSIRRESDQVEAVVADHGEGIAPEELPRLFGRFERVGAEKRMGPGGAGLGLAFVKSAVEKHGGTVEARSERGAGTRFIVRLPAK